MAIEFRLLGDVTVHVDGQAVDIGHARQRCVLVALLVEANRVVPVDQLLDRVWADRPPQRARNALAGYVSRLRRALPGVAVTRPPGGYLLTVDPLTVDLHRFGDLLVRARAATDEGEALARYEQALGLWQGEAFATLDSPWLDEVRRTLDAERLAAELDRNDLALNRGEHATRLGELSVRAAALPLDERLAGQLMLALYRCGRQADALLHYERVRLSLAEELGVDPSPPLRRLHQHMLTSDPVLALPGPAPTRWPIPHQLPAPPRSFTGRARELAALDAVLDATTREEVGVVVVSGTAGVGKTALALYWAHRVREHFPDGQLYLNLRGFDPGWQGMAAADAVRAFLTALGVPAGQIPTGLDEQAALYRSLLNGRRMLVVLDNAKDADQVRPLLPATPTALAVVTSRNQLSGLVAADGAVPVGLDLLTDAEARELLAGRIGHERVAAQPLAADTIVTACARLPLALVIAAARAAAQPDFPLTNLAAELAEAGHALAALSVGEPANDVQAVFSWSYAALTPAAARLFRLLGLHPGPDISARAAASLIGLPPAQVRPLLAELTRTSLLAEHVPGRYVFHDLLRGYATDLAHTHDPGNRRRAAVGRLLDHYLHTAYAADRRLNPHRDPLTLTPAAAGVTPEPPVDHAQAMTWLTAEHRVLLTAIDHAVRDGFHTHAWQLAFASSTFLTRRGHWHDQAAAGQAALEAARRLADPPAQAYAHRLIGRSHTLLGRHQPGVTHYRQALDLSTQARDPVGQGHTLHELAIAWARQGRPDRALEHARQALSRYRSAGNEPGQAEALNQVGWTYALLGDHHQALHHCEQALILLEKLSDLHGQANTWDSLGYAHHKLAHHGDAVACYRRAIDIFRDLGDRYQEATTLTNLGDAHHTAGEPDAARAAWQRALTILTELDHPDTAQLRTRLEP